ncbi:MAG: hypothetical protein JRH07_09520 [Deltaproteobacteria bacterium]|nr:hypothetical protein [Deltaproteobacteria bacterium]MBW2122071.1 hypothetical protein [Deltaproteobacteria bacterium]
MEPKTLFYIGITLGFVAGVVATLIVVKVRSLFASAETRRLRQEKGILEKRLQEKDRHIDSMMGHAERLARDLSKNRRSQGSR